VDVEIEVLEQRETVASDVAEVVAEDAVTGEIGVAVAALTRMERVPGFPLPSSGVL